jgi:radical SAM protein with 4Fe4S-binding SPASM domain
MLYRQRKNTFIRKYSEVGYIANRQDGSDYVTDEAGAVFLSAISRKAKNFQTIVSDIATSFVDVDMEKLWQDVDEFLAMLEQEGYIVKGETENELNKKDKLFSYSQFYSGKDNIPPIKARVRSTKTSSEFFEEYLTDNPHMVSFQFELTSKCNERCIHCYIPHEYKQNDISLSLFYDVLKQTVEMGAIDVILSGGEPMLHPHFCDFLHELQKYDVSVSILSNLTLLNEEMIGIMKNIRLYGIQVSLYSMTPSVHDSITKVPGSFDKTMNAIQQLIDNDIPLEINCPVMKANKDTYPAVRKWAEAHHIDCNIDFILLARYDHSLDNLENRIGINELEKIMLEQVENDIKYQSQVQESLNDTQEKDDGSDKPICGVGTRGICMAVNGNIYPCPSWQSYKLGNIQDQSLKDIWETSPQIKQLRSIRRSNFPKCMNCVDSKFCLICMARNANENSAGDPLKINEHFCKVAALNRKIVLDWKAKLQA